MMRRRFHLKSMDAPYVTALKFVSKPQYDVLIYVRDNPELPYMEGAKVMGVPINTFKTRLHRARVKILKWRSMDTLKLPVKNIEAP